MKVLIRNHTGRSGYLRRLKRDSLFLLKSFNLLNAELSILLVADKEMKRLNRTFRGQEKATDVLSFPLYNSLEEIRSQEYVSIGDIVINRDAAMRQASEYGVTYYDEVRRLLVHGFLHLLGYDHERSRYEGIKMRKKEKEYCDALKKMDQER